MAPRGQQGKPRTKRPSATTFSTTGNVLESLYAPLRPNTKYAKYQRPNVPRVSEPQPFHCTSYDKLTSLATGETSEAKSKKSTPAQKPESAMSAIRPSLSLAYNLPRPGIKTRSTRKRARGVRSQERKTREIAAPRPSAGNVLAAIMERPKRTPPADSRLTEEETQIYGNRFPKGYEKVGLLGK